MEAKSVVKIEVKSLYLGVGLEMIGCSVVTLGKETAQSLFRSCEAELFE